jgi:hypothetical protein
VDKEGRGCSCRKKKKKLAEEGAATLAFLLVGVLSPLFSRRSIC